MTHVRQCLPIDGSQIDCETRKAPVNRVRNVTLSVPRAAKRMSRHALATRVEPSRLGNLRGIGERIRARWESSFMRIRFSVIFFDSRLPISLGLLVLLESISLYCFDKADPSAWRC